MVDDKSQMKQEPPETPLPIEPLRASVKLASMRDLPSAIDRLGFKPYVEAMARFLTSPDTEAPLTISIEGKWGTGKTSFMDQLEEKLRKEHHEITIKFNAWRHDEEKSLWAAFALTLLDQLPAHESISRDHDFPRVHRWAGHIKLIWMRRKWKSLWLDALPKVLLGLIITCVALFLTSKGIIGIDGKGKLFFQTLTGIAGGSAWVAVLAVIWKNLIGKVQNPMGIDLNKYMSRPDYEGHTSFIENFQNDFQKIIQAYAGDAPVYAFIDDIDRCQLPKAAELMKALNLMLSGAPKVIFIIGMDREKVAAGLASDYEKIMPYLLHSQGDHEAAREENIDPAHGVRFAYNFIEKFIQLPFQVPIPEGNDLHDFLDKMGAPEVDGAGAARKRKTVIASVSGFFADKWTKLIGESSTSGKEEEHSTSADLGADSSTKGKQATQHETELEQEKEKRWDGLHLALGIDSPAVRNIALILAPHFDNNPRRLIQFINLFRLRAYIAHATGLFGGVGDIDHAKILTFEQLGKFVALSLKYPLLISELYDNPELLGEMQEYASSEGHLPEHPSAAAKKWMGEDGMFDFLGAGCFYSVPRIDIFPLPETMSQYTLAHLNVRALLRVSPAVSRSEVEPPPPDVPPEVSGKGVEPPTTETPELTPRVSETLDPEHDRILNEAIETWKAGRLAYLQDDMEEAERLYRESMAVAEELENNSVRGWNYQALGEIELLRRNFEAARDWFERAIDNFGELKDYRAAELVRNKLEDILNELQKEAPPLPEAQQLHLSESISFNYAPDNPADHGWKARGEPNLPKYGKGMDPIYGKYLQIIPTSKYRLDYPLGPLLEKTEIVRFITKKSSAGMKYVGVRCQSKEDPSSNILGWIGLKPDGRALEKDTRVNDEWVVGVRPKELVRGWVEQSISIESIFDESFGTEGWIYGGLIRLRLREEMEIGKIELYVSPQPNEVA